MWNWYIHRRSEKGLEFLAGLMGGTSESVTATLKTQSNAQLQGT